MRQFTPTARQRAVQEEAEWLARVRLGLWPGCYQCAAAAVWGRGEAAPCPRCGRQLWQQPVVLRLVRVALGMLPLEEAS